MISDAELIDIRIAALERRIKREQEFIKRMLALRKAGKGITTRIEYDPLRATKASHTKGKSKKKKFVVPSDFFVWDRSSVSPYQVIDHAQQRIKKLKNEKENLK